MEIKRLLKSDIENVVRIHNDSFKNFFLTVLGDSFLKVYYNSIRKNNKGILLGIFDNGELCGFCAATNLSKGFNEQLILKNILPFSLIGLKLFFTQPDSLFRLYKNFKKNDLSDSDSHEYAELLSIAVLQNKQGLGLGKTLLLKLEDDLKLIGCNELSLTTDFYDNDKTIQFYRGLGYGVLYEFIAFPDRKMYRMIKKIN
jgi:ribosomal protein S18 acetylase RimI-like enzyme